MLRSSSKIKMFGALVSFAALPLLSVASVFAESSTQNTNFRVNISDVLSVSVTTPDTWATGDAGQFLRNHIVISATTNNAAGLTTTMTTKTANTSLVNTRKSEYTIPTLSNSVQVASFPTSRWGFSLDDAVAAPQNDAWYDPLVGAGGIPSVVLETDAPGTGTQDIFFGAKASSTNASGTYESVVVFNVVTGVINDPTDPNGDPDGPNNPITPTNPSTPTTPNTPTYNPNNNQTTYTTVVPHTNDGTTTTTTEVSEGDTTQMYADPHGVTYYNTTTTTETNNGSALATGLAVAAAVSGATGFIFFIVGKRRKDEDEEEEGGEQQPPIQY